MRNDASILVLDENFNREFKIFKDVPESMSSVPPKKVLPYFI